MGSNDQLGLWSDSSAFFGLIALHVNVMALDGSDEKFEVRCYTWHIRLQVV